VEIPDIRGATASPKEQEAHKREIQTATIADDQPGLMTPESRDCGQDKKCDWIITGGAAVPPEAPSRSSPPTEGERWKLRSSAEHPNKGEVESITRGSRHARSSTFCTTTARRRRRHASRKPAKPRAAEFTYRVLEGERRRTVAANIAADLQYGAVSRPENTT